MRFKRIRVQVDLAGRGKEGESTQNCGKNGRTGPHVNSPFGSLYDRICFCADIQFIRVPINMKNSPKTGYQRNKLL
jgi:hypothetical protein